MAGRFEKPGKWISTSSIEKQTLNLNESAANSLKAVGKETGILFRDLRSVRAV